MKLLCTKPNQTLVSPQAEDTADVEQGFPDGRVVRPGVAGREQAGRRDEHHPGHGQAARHLGRGDRVVQGGVHQDGAGRVLAGRRAGHVLRAHLPQTAGRRRGHVQLAGAPTHHARSEYTERAVQIKRRFPPRLYSINHFRGCVVVGVFASEGLYTTRVANRSIAT